MLIEFFGDGLGGLGAAVVNLIPVVAVTVGVRPSVELTGTLVEWSGLVCPLFPSLDSVKQRREPSNRVVQLWNGESVRNP